MHRMVTLCLFGLVSVVALVAGAGLLGPDGTSAAVATGVVILFGGILWSSWRQRKKPSGGSGNSGDGGDATWFLFGGNSHHDDGHHHSDGDGGHGGDAGAGHSN